VIFAFGNHQLDIERRELRRDNEVIDLEPQVFDLLAFLIRNRERVVSKDDLLRAVWDGRAVSESALTTRVNAVRRAVDDDGETQRLIRTFTRRGIRFIGDVVETPDAAVSQTGVGRDPVDMARPSPDAASAEPSIAVLPFANLSGDPEQEYFADGMVEEITIAISRFPWLLVIARNSSFTYKGKAIDVKQVRHELGVRYVLEGSVRRSGDRVRVSAQLIVADTGAHLWADRFDNTLEDILDLQGQVAASVVGAIEPKLRLVEIERLSRKPTESLDARDLNWRARAQVYKRTRESLAEAVRLAQQALQLDPNYGPAMARIAGCRTMQLARHWIPTSGQEVDEGIRMARRAISASGDDPEVLRMAGYALAHLAGENDTALDALDRAITLNANFAQAYGQRAMVLSFLNRPDEAILSAQRAIRLSPLDPGAFAFFFALGLAHHAAGRYEEALPWADRSVRENGGAPPLRLKLGLCGHLGRTKEAEDCLRRLREIHPPPPCGIYRRASQPRCSRATLKVGAKPAYRRGEHHAALRVFCTQSAKGPKFESLGAVPRTTRIGSSASLLDAQAKSAYPRNSGRSP
jgi:TolB-like protein/tetratricopeptide (TPR) repeat protein